MPKGSDASASAAVPVRERLRRMERCTKKTLEIAPYCSNVLRHLSCWCGFEIDNRMASVLSHKATPIATTTTLLSQHLPQSFFARPAEVVAPELIGCLLVKRQVDGELLWGVIVETEAYSQDDPACHGYRRRTPSNETLFGEPGGFMRM